MAKKSLILVCSLLFVSILFPISGNAKESNVITEDFNNTQMEFENKELELMDSIISGGTVNLNKVEQQLYPVFSDQEEALKKLKNTLPEYLKKISEVYNLGEISDNNWMDYVDCAQKYSSETLSEEDYQYNLFLKFIDIYENKSKNSDIKEMVSEYELSQGNNVVEKQEDNIIESIILALPYTSEIATKYNQQQLHSKTNVELMASHDLNRALQYVNLYAVNPNQFFAVQDNDCTNFASQILYAGNVKMEDYYPNENRGWWFRRVEGFGGAILAKYSVSWIRADTFAKYMGVGLTTTNHSTFSSNLKAGDFIAFDRYNDGDWNHVGYVTDVDSYQGTYGNYTYYDYKVAQHTNNYHAWTSSSTNGWETLSNANYGRVRR